MSWERNYKLFRSKQYLDSGLSTAIGLCWVCLATDTGLPRFHPRRPASPPQRLPAGPGGRSTPRHELCRQEPAERLDSGQTPDIRSWLKSSFRDQDDETMERYSESQLPASGLVGAAYGHGTCTAQGGMMLPHGGAQPSSPQECEIKALVPWSTRRPRVKWAEPTPGVTLRMPTHPSSPLFAGLREGRRALPSPSWASL